MNNDIKIHTVRVFVDENGKFGNPLGIIVDENSQIDKKERQKIATKLGYSESVFINNLSSGNISIFNPQSEVAFAGHAIIGTAWFINNITHKIIDSLMCGAGSIKTWKDNNKTWIRANLKMMPPWNYEQLKSPQEVKKLSLKDTSPKKHIFVWAWIDKDKGLIRARTFASDWGIPEDEANGSGSMKLAAKLGRSLEIFHGKGSVIYVKPFGADFCNLGGRVSEENYGI